MKQHVELICPACGAKNRLPAMRIVRLTEQPHCGRCRTSLTKPASEPLVGLTGAAYQHPLDREALRALERVPGIKSVLKWLLKQFPERLLRLSHEGSFVRVGPEQLPELWARYQRMAERLDIHDLPDLFVYQNPLANAYTYGVDQAFIAISSSLLDLVEDDEADSVLAHELAHWQSGHVLYKTAARLMASIMTGAVGRFIRLGPVILYPLAAALSRWDQASELTADRGAVLAVGNPEVVLRTQMKLSGGSQKLGRAMSFEAFLAQAEAFDRDQARNLLSKLMVLMMSLFRTHPLSVWRAAEVVAWATSGEMIELLAGRYDAEGLVATVQCERCGRHRPAGSELCPYCIDEDDLEVEFEGEAPSASAARDTLNKAFDGLRDFFNFEGPPPADDDK